MTAVERTQLLVDIRRIIREEFEAYEGNGDIVDSEVDASVEPEIDLGDN